MFGIMISFDDIPEIYIVKNVTDLRKGIDGYVLRWEESRKHKKQSYQKK